MFDSVISDASVVFCWLLMVLFKIWIWQW